MSSSSTSPAGPRPTRDWPRLNSGRSTSATGASGTPMTWSTAVSCCSTSPTPSACCGGCGRRCDRVVLWSSRTRTSAGCSAIRRTTDSTSTPAATGGCSPGAAAIRPSGASWSGSSSRRAFPAPISNSCRRPTPAARASCWRTRRSRRQGMRSSPRTSRPGRDPCRPGEPGGIHRAPGQRPRRSAGLPGLQPSLTGALTWPRPGVPGRPAFRWSDRLSFRWPGRGTTARPGFPAPPPVRCARPPVRAGSWRIPPR